jgi:serine/threonine protein kinase
MNTQGTSRPAERIDKSRHEEPIRYSYVLGGQAKQYAFRLRCDKHSRAPSNAKGGLWCCQCLADGRRERRELNHSDPLLDSRLLAGQLIGGQYRVGRLLGEGGMASVWAGTNERTGKLVALKVIRKSFMAMPGAEAFLRSEGLAASRVNHPNVVTMFDVIESEGMTCIVMELLDGIPLGTYISCNGRLSLDDAAGLLLPAMHGVAAAHAEGVIHRDLKPQNIFICVDLDEHIVTTKVLDFGIATMMDWTRGRSVSAIPGLVGTPSYMAPEHIEGASDPDKRTDVYGFGLLFYETLSGLMAFPGEPSVELLRRILIETAAPLGELRPDLPLGMVQIVERALSKRPEDRFETLNQMMSAIEAQMMPQPPAPASASPIPMAALAIAASAPLPAASPARSGEAPSNRLHATRLFGPLMTDRPAAGGRLVLRKARKRPVQRALGLAGVALVITLGGRVIVQEYETVRAVAVVPLSPARTTVPTPRSPTLAPVPIVPSEAAPEAVGPRRQLATGALSDPRVVSRLAQSIPRARPRLDRASITSASQNKTTAERPVRGGTFRAKAEMGSPHIDRPPPRAGLLTADDF